MELIQDFMDKMGIEAFGLPSELQQEESEEDVVYRWEVDENNASE